MEGTRFNRSAELKSHEGGGGTYTHNTTKERDSGTLPTNKSAYNSKIVPSCDGENMRGGTLMSGRQQKDVRTGRV